MASDLISRDQLLGDLYAEWLLCTPDTPTFINGELQRCEKAKLIEEGMKIVQNQPTVDAVEVVHGEWDRIGGDIHSSGYAVYCSVCHKPHFVHHKFSLGALTYDELFKEPNYCSNCGAKMNGVK